MTGKRRIGRAVPLAAPFGRLAQGPGTSRGVILSAVLHLGTIAFLVWGGLKIAEADRLPGAGRGRGGGGGGGNRALTFFTIARASEPPAAPAPELTIPKQLVVTPPEVKPPEQQALAPADSVQPVAGAGAGAGQGAGTGPGSRSGTGGGSGSGVGPGTGPDSGGDGGRIFPPQPLGIILPPPDRPSSLRGTTIIVRFDISERGEVLDVTLDPPIRDRRFRNDFLERMRRYTFTPAYTLDGRPIRAIYPVRITL